MNTFDIISGISITMVTFLFFFWVGVALRIAYDWVYGWIEHRLNMCPHNSLSMKFNGIQAYEDYVAGRITVEQYIKSNLKTEVICNRCGERVG